MTLHLDNVGRSACGQGSALAPNEVEVTCGRCRNSGHFPEWARHPESLPPTTALHYPYAGRSACRRPYQPGNLTEEWTLVDCAVCIELRPLIEREIAEGRT